MTFRANFGKIAFPKTVSSWVTMNMPGELIPHISIGLELVNSLWRELSADNAEAWKHFSEGPSSEDVRMHLLHLVGSHHGEMLFGSPGTQRRRKPWRSITSTISMRAWRCLPPGLSRAKLLTDRIFDRVRPLPGNLRQIAREISSTSRRSEKKKAGCCRNGAHFEPSVIPSRARDLASAVSHYATYFSVH